MKISLKLKWMLMLAVIPMTACVSQRPAPVVDRSARTVATAPVPAPAPRQAKDGMYTVQRGDTLYSVALAFGLDHVELARWNNVPDGGALRIGQSLRVIPPVEVATTSPITRSGQAEVRPLPAPGAAEPAAPTPLPPPSTTPPVTTPPPPPTATSPSAPATEVPRSPSSGLPWLWPASGKVIETFDDPRNKGIDIAGIEGAPVQAAADGEVVYVGSAVRGYGNLVIVRHSDDFITAYAHNRKVLVAEKQSVRRGQTIAELGRSDADRPKLHFELRHQGKPVDPLKYLPAR